MEIPKEKTIAFLGCRIEEIQSFHTDKNLKNVLYTELGRIIADLYEQGYTHYCSGMSAGMGMLAANAVLDFKVEHPDIFFVAVIPFRGQQEGYSTTDKNDYQVICTEADEVIVLCEASTGKEQILRHNNYLLEHCSVVVCYHDGKSDETMHTYNRAEQMGLHIINIHERLSGYFANTSKAKKTLQRYSHAAGFNYCKEGILLPRINEKPLIITFEEIKAVKKKEEILYVILQNGMEVHTSLFSDEYEIHFPEQEKPSM